MLLTTPAQVRRFCRELSGAPFIAVDTEFQWDRTYFANLSLVQMASQDHVGLIDCVAVSDLSPLKDILCGPESVKVFHSASQDLSILGRVLGEPVSNIYDSQIGQALLGGPHQASYGKLVAGYLDITVDKSIQHTDWLRRPLSEKQLVYARADVVHLAEIYPQQTDRLQAAGRLHWAREDSAWLERNPPSEATEPAEAYLQVKGWGRLDRRQLGNLVALSEWREEYCHARNIRPRWLIPDGALLGFAAKGRFAKSVLSREKPWVGKRVQKLRQELSEVLEAAAAGPARPIPGKQRHGRPSALEKRLVKLADSRISERAEGLGIEKMLLASRAEFTALVRYIVHRGHVPEDARLLQGWRRQVIGEELAESVLTSYRQACD